MGPGGIDADQAMRRRWVSECAELREAVRHTWIAAWRLVIR